MYVAWAARPGIFRNLLLAQTIWRRLSPSTIYMLYTLQTLHPITPISDCPDHCAGGCAVAACGMQHDKWLSATYTGQ